jgi:Flp pilus assembly pilin Flp
LREKSCHFDFVAPKLRRQTQIAHPKKTTHEGFTHMITKLKNFIKDETGQDVVEYSLLLVLIGTVAMIYLTGVGLNISALLQNIGAKLDLVSKAAD